MIAPSSTQWIVCPSQRCQRGEGYPEVGEERPPTARDVLDETRDAHDVRSCRSAAQRLDLQGATVGELITRRNVSTVTVQWQSGWFDRFGRAVRSVQARWASGPESRTVQPPDGVLYVYEDGSGQTVSRIGEQDWAEIIPEVKPPGEDLVLQGGGPAPPDIGGPEFFQARQVPPPDPPSGFVEVVPGQPGRIIAVGAPEPTARTVRVETRTAERPPRPPTVRSCPRSVTG